MEKLTRAETEKRINEEFSKKLTPEKIKKLKRLAMRYNIKLKGLRKKFCRKCYSSLKDSDGKVKNKIKTTKCENCGFVSRWKIK